LDHSPFDDHYRLLGVSPEASAEELRRAYRQLARRYHPDVAGAGSTETFRRIAAAYALLSDVASRAEYDARRRSLSAPATSGAAGRQARPARGSRHPASDLIERLAGALDSLVARQAARRAPDGAIELLLTPAEASRGGTAALDTTVLVTCTTCGGLAERRSVWCARCEYRGTVRDEITACVPIPAEVCDGALFTVAVDELGRAPPLRVRVRVR
jgi:molecular chaperone DnaJ